MDDHGDLLSTVASLYYKLDQSQAEIAERLGVSTSKISRMLKEARERGIVDIRIHMPIPRALTLEQEVCELFGLREAFVLQTSGDVSDDTALLAIGQLAASYLQRLLPNLPTSSTLGVTWGTSANAAISALGDFPGFQMDVVQLMGGVGQQDVDGPDIARKLAGKLGGRHYDLPAPVLVELASSRDLFLQEPTVREGLIRARQVRVAIAGVGAVQEKSSSFMRAGLLTRSDLAHLRAQGAVGEMVGRFFKSDGTMDGIDINERIIGIALDDLRRLPHCIAIARGQAKVEAICGALRGRYLTALVTDDVTARGVLAHAIQLEKELR